MCVFECDVMYLCVCVCRSCVCACVRAYARVVSHVYLAAAFVLQYASTNCNSLQLSATHCNTYVPVSERERVKHK